MPNPLVIHHNDNDGFCAALIAKKALTDQFKALPEFFETNYGQEPPDAKDRDVYILDFSYPRATLEAMHAAASSLIVLDHHKTAQADLEGLPYCIYDMGKSGCRLAQEYFGQRSHWLIDYVEDRDLWKWQLENSQEINAAIASYPKGFDEWEKLWERDPNELITEGAAIKRYQDRIVEVLCSHAETWNIGGHEVPIVNSPVLQSEIGQKLAQGNAFGAVYFDKADGTRTYSLRSVGDFDVSALATQFGGGGHARAAGFTEAKP